MSIRRIPIWLILIIVSIVAHAILSWKIGRDIEFTVTQPVENEIRLSVSRPPQPRALERPPPDEMLEFEEDVELEPPEILVRPQAVTPPPPDVPVALTAASGGMTGLELSNPIAALPLGQGFGTAGFGVGIGNALGNSSNRFAAYVEGLRNNGLDVVFVVDATGSMSWVIDEVKFRIHDITQMVRSLVPIARFGIVAYRDRKDPEFVTRQQPLTFSTAKMRGFLDKLVAFGGGDLYEAIGDGLQVAIEESGWRAGARHLIIVIGDAPPRREELGGITRRIEGFARVGGTVSTLDVGPEANPALIEAKTKRKINRALYRNEPLYEFSVIADAGNGDSATLEGDVRITKRLITLIMGDQFAREMRALLEVI